MNAHERYLHARRRRDAGATFLEIAGEIGVCEETVRRICMGESPVPKRDPHRCGGCGAKLVVEVCIKCHPAQAQMIGVTQDTDDMPDVDEIWKRAAEIRADNLRRLAERETSRSPGCVYGSAGIREYGFSVHRNGRSVG